MKIIILVLVVFSGLTYSQQEPIVTDRPDITESALTVPKSSFQVETGFTVQNSKDEENTNKANIRDISVLNTLLRYGLLNDLELRLGSEYLYQKVDLEARSKAEGINGLLAGAKYQLLRDNPSLPDAALFFHLNIPFGSESFKAENIEPEMLLAASHALSQILSLSYNLGGMLNSSDEKVYYFYSISLAATLSDKAGAFIEYFGETAAGAEFHNIDGGFTYLIQYNFQFDISAGINLDQPEDNWFLSTGISFRLPE